MRFGKSIRPATRATLLLLVAGCAPTTPLLFERAPPRAATFSLSDSGEVVRRVQQVFSCPASPSSLRYGTLGWRRESGFVDVTVVQEMAPTVEGAVPHRACWKGFRVDAEGNIFALPEKDWPYTAFRKSRPPAIPT